MGEGRRIRLPLAGAEQLPENCPLEGGPASAYPGAEQPPNAKRHDQSDALSTICL
ncbi:hypothetical protein GCM10022383_21510 [Microbacterium soli]|uniref:Uncharacterized protein n=1 Tax=Microbacterium soli TaxID=446075 RepID=A0ABP7NF08_9MICO